MSKCISLLFQKVTKVKLLVAVAFFSMLSLAKAQNIAEGESLFKQKCTACHAIDKQVVGPALKGVETRRSEEWLIKWVKDSQALVKLGDKDAVALFDQYKVPMSSFPDLTDDNIKNIIAYVKDAANKPAAPAATASKDAPKAEATTAQSSSMSSILVTAFSIVLLISLVVLVVLNKVVARLSLLVYAKSGLTEEEIAKQKKEDTLSGWFCKKMKNKKFMAMVVLIVLVVVGGAALDYMWNIGVHTGYKPEQPIKFSHQLHAGTNKIDCRYCHSGAYKSRHASIPSANVCMNCHSYVQATEKYDGQISPEIKKIYAALDYNPETRTYGNNPKPIKWIRIHNLPDLAYFNHSQHVKVAGVKCQKCHGPVETMKEVYQYSPLTMKWCINCHRETDVNVKGNAYYSKMVDYHEKLKKGEKVTVKVIGGLECGKCHY